METTSCTIRCFAQPYHMVSVMNLQYSGNQNSAVNKFKVDIGINSTMCSCLLWQSYNFSLNSFKDVLG